MKGEMRRLISDTFSELVKTQDVDKITVTMLIGECHISRQTFYYHFQDKYELLDWFYYEECFVPILDGITFDNWHLRIKQLLDTLKKEKVFYSNVIKNAGEGFSNYLYSITSTLFEEAAAVLDEEGLVNGEEKKFIGSFYAYGICGVVMQWVTDGMKEQTDEVAQRLRRLARSTELLASRRFADMKNESSEPQK